MFQRLTTFVASYEYNHYHIILKSPKMTMGASRNLSQGNILGFLGVRVRWLRMWPVWSVQRTGLWRRKHNEWHIWRGSEVYSWKATACILRTLSSPQFEPCCQWCSVWSMRRQDCFSTVQELYAFFGHSIRRWDLDGIHNRWVSSHT